MESDERARVESGFMPRRLDRGEEWRAAGMCTAVVNKFSGEGKPFLV